MLTVRKLFGICFSTRAKLARSTRIDGQEPSSGAFGRGCARLAAASNADAKRQTIVSRMEAARNSCQYLSTSC